MIKNLWNFKLKHSELGRSSTSLLPTIWLSVGDQNNYNNKLSRWLQDSTSDTSKLQWEAFVLTYLNGMKGKDCLKKTWEYNFGSYFCVCVYVYQV